MAARPDQKSKKNEKGPKVKARDATKDQIAELEKQISETKYNKKTQHAIGQMKAKVALLKEKQEQRASQSGGAGEGYAVRKTGDGTVVLLGFPSAGKSTLLNTLTNAESEVGDYAFTTLTVVPGVMPYKHARIQILDVPGIISGAASGSGRGKEVLQVVRNADLVLMVIDVFNPEQYIHLLKEVRDTGVRMNKRKPEVKIRRTSKDGIRVGATVPLEHITTDDIETIAKTFRIMNAEILIRSDIDQDDFIDVIRGNCVYIPMIKILNKVDIADPASLEKARKLVKPDLEISAQQKLNTDELRELLFQRLSFMRIYLKENRKAADMDEPLIMQTESTIGDVCSKLHKDFLKKFRYARIWGPSAKFNGQKILKTSHELKDGDILEITLK